MTPDPATGLPTGEGDEVGAPLQRWRLVIAYDGSSFRGFAAQPGVRTVARVLTEALGRVTRFPGRLRVTAAGRTDAGVHARGQVVRVDLPVPPAGSGAGAALDPPQLLHSLNRQLSPAIVVRSAAPVPPGFDARRSALGRAYRYLVWSSPVPDPLLAPVAWHVAEGLDLRAMTAASDALVGEHDFRAFCRRPPGGSPDQEIIRVVTRAAWSVDEDGEVADAGEGRLLRFDMEASSFCHQMVRSAVGWLVGVGRGRGNVATTMALLRSGRRNPANQLAPAHGLCLVSVRYG